MSEITVTKSNPLEPEALALLKASHALMQSLFPPEDNFYLEPEALTAPDVVFFTARKDGKTLGTGALATRKGYGEVKSMFTHEDARGLGVGGRILAAIELEARAQGLPMLKLETGNTLYAAHRLYEAAGFTRCAAYGDYPDAASSIFMEKRLTD